jgi:hypothetical protein
MKHFVDSAKTPLPCLQGFQGYPAGGTLDKMMSGRKSENTGRRLSSLEKNGTFSSPLFGTHPRLK